MTDLAEEPCTMFFTSMNEHSLKKTLSKLNIGGLRYFDSIGSTNDEALAWAARLARLTFQSSLRMNRLRAAADSTGNGSHPKAVDWLSA